MKKLLCFSIFIMLLCLSCCTSKPASFYLLTPTHTGKMKSFGKERITIGLGPVNIAKYIDMPQIVTRDNHHQININEYHRWSSPLLDNILNVLNENLTYLIPNATILQYPWKMIIALDYQIEINIWRMDVDRLGISVLNINWSIYGEQGNKLLLNTTTTYRSQIPVPINYNIYAADMSSKLSAFSRDIAKAIKKMCEK